MSESLLNLVIVVTGVAGSGKTTVGKHLAARLGVPFEDGDDFHPSTNVAKMARGEPLDDADREPWLERLRHLIQVWRGEGQGGVLACSALRAPYRDLLRVDDGVRFVLLTASPETLQRRLDCRDGHFFPAELLNTQLATLERAPDVPAVEAEGTVDQTVSAVIEALKGQAGSDIARTSPVAGPRR